MAPREALFRAPLHPYTAALMAAIPVPDPARERSKKHVALKGETPDPANIPGGCRFHSRCPRAIEVCRSVDPVLVEKNGDHRVACHNPL
jgi:oligopeptide/dipeptide ABC transporter ATP-binding protein